MDRDPELGTPPFACAECGVVLTDDMDREDTGDAVFCRSCFELLTAQLELSLAAQRQDINYPSAAFGGLLGAAVGSLVWWGFTVLSGISFGLVAVVIGFATSMGVVMFSGGKRSRGLQGLSLGIAMAGFVYASYLVNRTFIQRAYSEQGQIVELPWFPPVDLLAEVLRLNFGIMDLVFLAIVAYQAWRGPAPPRLAT